MSDKMVRSYASDDKANMLTVCSARICERLPVPTTSSSAPSTDKHIELSSLLMDEDRMRSERSDRKTWKSRVTGLDEFDSGGSQDSPRRRERPHRAQRSDEEDAEYKLAIEASRYQEEEDRKKRESRGQGPPDDDDLAKAIKLSKEEEELRRRELEESNAASLFDDDPIQTAQPNYTGFNQGYQQQGAVDWSGNPIDQNAMQQQSTGFLNNAYSNPTGFANQPTGYQSGYGFPSQPTGYDPYAQQQQMQPQPTGYNPYVQQNQTGYGQQLQPQPEPLVPASTNNPWATNQQQQAQAPLQPMKTGSNNPFASASRPQPTSSFTQPSLSTLQEQKTASAFQNNNSTFTPPPMPPMPTAPQKEISPHEARLNALLSSGDGMDTFGNTGNMRIPAQHTAPGTFVNSAAHGLGRINEQATGNNPFLSSQFTGMPQTQYGQAGHQMPAATGPAGGYGGGFGAQQGSSNPFGQRPQQQQGQGGQDLIQF